jgi:hypothetical protein
MNEDFIFRLGADVSSFTKSITEVEAELTQARKAVKGALGDDLIKANQYVQDLEQSLKDLKSVGVQVPGAAKAAKEIANVAPEAKKAQVAIGNLGQVARDLPFGFIAIQNNLPILFDSLGNLSKESGGAKNALKNLGAALAGPVGITFAVGAVISGITALVQKYGSLSAAISEVLILEKSQKDLNNELNTAISKTVGESQAEITTLNNLVGILTNTNSSLYQRNGAYDELNQKYPGLLSNLSKEEIATGGVNATIAARIALFAKEIELNGKRSALEKLIGQEAEKSYTSLSKLANQSFLDGLTAELQGVLLGFNAGTAGLQSFAQQTQNGAKTTQFFEGILKGVQGQLSATTGEINALKEAEKKRLEEERKAIQAANELANANKRVAQSFAERSKKSFEANAEDARLSGANSVFAGLTKNEQIIKANTISFKMWTKKLREANRAAKESNLIPKTIGTQATVTPNQPEIETQVQNATDAIAELNKEANLSAAFSLINDTFFSPIQGLFEGLISGAKNSMQEFGKAITNALKQLVAKIIATGIIQLIGVLLSGGFSAGAGGAANGFKQVLKGIGAAFGFGGIANPNFGGVTGGGMAMSGAVNVVLRGQDLVGSLNRTNAQINRVG